ncbi:membrane protein [Devosia limi DSM 17137]|uniref:Membrane protein n=2 Tax=Devosia TaxID=46913 RepID=A0A0F5LAJ8_9HYPH|nr:Tim44 domain-containing protein [Devosia limi]KKB79368.1 membrane protein [Devosia limi DSM 17137]SHF30819.1 Predicted lipid-binding transport protein, Tim44 family [Devosia limi DSM 17137]
MFASRGFRLASLFACVAVAFSMVSVDEAQARKGGSFGNRGTRTFQSAPTTNTAPAPTAPVQRTMAPSNQPGAATAGTAASQPRAGFMGGLGGSLLRGVMLGGLLGLLFGGGFGGMAGLLGLLVQVALIGGAVFLVMRFLKSRSAMQPAMAGAGGGMNRSAHEPQRNPLGGLAGLAGGLGGGQARAETGAARPEDANELNIGGADLEIFERMLTDVQSAFGREDYAALRRLVTAEMVSYLAEELAENSAKGVRNDVSDVKLLQGDLAESWREGGVEYATAAMRYSVLDCTRDRVTGEVVDGDAENPSESTELWTFVRDRGGDWKLSAIQEA